MRIWTRKSAPIQPRTSLWKSDVSWLPSDWREEVVRLLRGKRRPRGPRRPARLPARSAMSSAPSATPILLDSKFCQNFIKISSNNFSKIFIIFCIQYSIFQHFSKSTHFCKILQKKYAKFCKFFADFWKFCKILQNLPKNLKIFTIFSNFWQKFAKFAREKVIFL